MINNYIKKLNEKLAAGDATEHTHRSTLEELVQSFDKTLQISNEPKRIRVGAPDLVVRKRIRKSQLFPLGYIETKDIGNDLSKIEKTEQLVRYLQLPNLILTDYLEFRWYVNGEQRGKPVILGKVVKGKIKLEPDAAEKLTELFESFLAQEVTDISSPKELAARMAGLCKNIDRIITETFAAGEASDLMQDLKSAFERTLLPEITDAQFADMFAQTLGYGLFAARIHHSEMKPGDPFTRTGAAREIPKSNPFLRNLFDTIHSADLEDEAFIGFVDDLTAVLAHTDMAAVLASFGKRTKQEDPILHFYETFLSEYDPKERKRRGVYYTPEPVVSYIVRSVDILLKEKFGLPDGLADTSMIEVEVKEGDKYVKRTLPKVLILDPACGTGTFLYAVIDLIRNRFMEQNRAGEWRSFVSEHLIPRIYGFELQMAPYAVAHLKLAMQLAGHDLTDAQRKKWGYDFSKDERLNVYLTNSLEETIYKTEELLGTMKIISQEANAAATVKNRLPILVILGNPPYSGHSANRSEIVEEIKLKNGKIKKVKRLTFIGDKLRDYYLVDGEPLGEKNPKWLQDDYVKFLRYGQWRIGQWSLGEHGAQGILGFITNHSYLDNPTFRGMRRSLQQTFDEIYLLDLHGNSKKKEITPDGGKDENVFDIMQGVSIGLFVKTYKEEKSVINRGDIWGKRDDKYAQLKSQDIRETEWMQIEPSKPFYLFCAEDMKGKNEIYGYSSLVTIYPTNVLGFQTHRDSFAIDFDEEELRKRISVFRSSRYDDAEVRALFGISDNRDWSISEVRERLRKDRNWQSYLSLCSYRPFDNRPCYFTEYVMDYPRRELLNHVFKKDNLCMLVSRQQATAGFRHAFVARIIAESCVVSLKTREQNYVFPLYLYPEDGEPRKPNLDAKFVTEFAGKLGLEFVEEGAPYFEGKSEKKKKTPPNPPKPSLEGNKKFGPEDIFYYIYAVFHSPTYRDRYKEFLKIDFPRVPLTSNRKLFGTLVKLGHELTQYHLLEHPALNDTPVRFPEPGSNQVDKVRYDEKNKRVYINSDQYFETVPKDVWEFHVGGYQVCHKWLKDRKGRELSHDDLRHYEKVVMALGETIRLMKKIDEAIPEWPIQ